MVRGHETSRLRHVTAVSRTPTRFTTESARLAPSQREDAPTGSHRWCLGNCWRSLTLHPRLHTVIHRRITFLHSCGCYAKPKEDDVRLLRPATLTRQPTRVLRYMWNEHS